MKPSTYPITGAILAGGKSRRMGTDKALLDLGGKPVIQRLVEQFDAIFEEVIIVANDLEKYAAFNKPVFADIYTEMGPLAGLHSALSHATCEWTFVSACDSPFFDKNLFELMNDQHDGMDAVVCETDDGLQPLTALYSKRCLSPIESCLKSDRLKVVSFHDQIRLHVVADTKTSATNARMFWNMNYPEDYEQAVRWIEDGAEA